MTTKIGEKEKENELMQALYLIDNDRDRKISASHIETVAKELGEHFSREEIEEMIMEADEDGDGEVGNTMVKKTAVGW